MCVIWKILCWQVVRVKRRGLDIGEMGGALVKTIGNSDAHSEAN